MGTVSFLSNPKYEQFLYSTNASAVLVHEDFSPLMKINPSLIRVKDVGLSIAKLFEHFSTPKPHKHHPNLLQAKDSTPKPTLSSSPTLLERHLRAGPNSLCFLASADRFSSSS